MKLITVLVFSLSITAFTQTEAVKIDTFNMEICGPLLSDAEVISECEDSFEVETIHEEIEKIGGKIIETTCDSVSSTKITTRLGKECKTPLIRKAYKSSIKVNYLLDL